MRKKILRLKLTDFINNDLQDNVINFIKIIKENPDTNNFLTIFWYNDGEISINILKEFERKIVIDFPNLDIEIVKLIYETPAWYDIINKENENELRHYKFRSTYSNPDDILMCLIEFSNVLKFENKKNGYNKKDGYNKDAKSRYNRFKSLGK